MRGDEQELEMRCGTPGTSWHVTTKSSIHNWGVLYKSGVYALKVTCFTPGGLPYAIASRLRLIAWLKGEQSTLTVWQESAEGIVGVETSPISGEASPTEGLNGTLMGLIGG